MSGVGDTSQDSPLEIKRPIDSAIENLELKSPFQEDPVHYRAVAHLRAGGAEAIQISVMLGLPMDEVKTILGLRKIKDEVFAIQKKYANRDFQNLFKDMLPDAIDVVRSIMIDPAVNSGTRLSAANQVMDRALGRPQQNVEIQSSMIRDLFQALDKHEQNRVDRAIQIERKSVNNGVIDGECQDVTAESDKPSVDKTDSWIEENL